MNKVILFFMVAVTLRAPCFAQNSTETLTVSTYYPAPFGVYRNLKLNPTTQPIGPAVSPGVMYYDNSPTMQRIRYRNATQWVNLTEGGGGASSCVTATCTHPDSAGIHTNCTVTCSSGYYVTGGASVSFNTNPAKTTFEFDYPVGSNRWYCEGNQGGTCYARCCP